jgi:hypothetical protein
MTKLSLKNRTEHEKMSNYKEEKEKNIELSRFAMITSKIKNLSRLALISGFAMVGAVALSPKAQAQSYNVDFAGSTNPTCTAIATNGTLGIVSNNNLRSSASYGTPGKITVTCSTGTTFTIASIADNGSVLTSGAFTDILSITSSLYDGTTQLVTADIAPDDLTGSPTNEPPQISSLQSGPITAKEYSLHLDILKTVGVPLPQGNYNVRVGITLTPQ